MLASIAAAMDELPPSPSVRVAASTATASARPRPLVVEWPQVKAVLAMADAALRCKKGEVEV